MNQKNEIDVVHVSMISVELSNPGYSYDNTNWDNQFPVFIDYAFIKQISLSNTLGIPHFFLAIACMLNSHQCLE